MLMLNNFSGFGVAPAAAGGTGYRYWKFTFSNGGDAEVEFAEVALMIGGTDQTGSGTASATNTNGANPASNAFDNNTGTKWAGFPLDATLTYDFGSGNNFAITTYSIQAISAAGHYPRSWTLARSSDDATYTTVDTQTGQSFTSLETKTYTIP